MPRWEPDSRGRLESAALDLFGDRGFENATVAEIAARAGVTERTFFRHFADKRDVFFGGAPLMQERLAAATAEAPASVKPMDAVLAGLDAASIQIEERPEFARARQSAISASPELQERELITLASLTTALTEALHGRGIEEPAASLTAEVGISVFRISVERWSNGAVQRNLHHLIRETLAELKQLV